jgi:superfamily II DNA or RNA helicase
MSNNRVLVIAHREELIYQAVGHAKAAGLTAGIEMGSIHSIGENVVVATVQTLVSRRKCKTCGGEGCPDCDDKGFKYRMERLNPWDFNAVIIDEGHHATSRTYRQVINHFRQNENMRVLLVTATPQRSDKVGLWNVVDSCAYRMELRDAVEEGWLCPIRQAFIEVHGLDLSMVGNKAGGDLADGDLERAFLGESDEEEERMLHEVARPAVEMAAGRPLLIFAAGVQHAKKLMAACNAYDGVQAECVLGETDKELRKEIIGRYKRGETNVLVGCGVFTEGFDAPATEFVAMARPTKSLSLYLQCIGRGTRPLPGVVDGIDDAEGRRAAIANSAKPHCVVLDFVGNSGNHKLVSVANCLAGSAVKEGDLEEAIRIAKEQAKNEDGGSQPIDMEELIKKVREARERKEREAEEARRLKVSTRTKAERIDYTSQDIDLFRGDPLDLVAKYKPKPGGASEPQVRYMIKLGVDPKTAMACSFNQAGSIINKLKSQTGGDFILAGGKHRGKKISQVPASYRVWLAETNAMGAAEHVAAFYRQGAVQ